MQTAKLHDGPRVLDVNRSQPPRDKLLAADKPGGVKAEAAGEGVESAAKPVMVDASAGETKTSLETGTSAGELNAPELSPKRQKTAADNETGPAPVVS